MTLFYLVSGIVGLTLVLWSVVDEIQRQAWREEKRALVKRSIIELENWLLEEDRREQGRLEREAYREAWVEKFNAQQAERNARLKTADEDWVDLTTSAGRQARLADVVARRAYPLPPFGTVEDTGPMGKYS